MMQIADVIFARGTGAYFYDDQAAIRAGVESDGFTYRGQVLTPGFRRIRQPAEVLGIGLRLSDGAVLWGDAMSVQYSGAGGRDPLFHAAEAEAFARAAIVPHLIGREVRDFRSTCEAVLATGDGQSAPGMALQYGISQALLRASAHARRETMAETVCRDFGLPVVPKHVPIFAQSGDDRVVNVDKMILKGCDILPHGLINAAAKFGRRGEVFREFIRHVAARSIALGGEDYRPILHFDLYGWIGLEFGLDVEVIADFLAVAAEDAAPFALQIESPADFGSRDAHVAGYKALVECLEAKGVSTRIVADEWCNTLEDVELFAAERAGHILQIKTPDLGSIANSVKAVLACRQHGAGAYLGGSCVETEVSAQACVHVAVATQADMMLAKPGMGVDEAMTIVGNEQNRLLAMLASTMDRGR